MSLIEDVREKENVVKTKETKGLGGYISVNKEEMKRNKGILLIKGTKQPDILKMQDMREKEEDNGVF